MALIKIYTNPKNHAESIGEAIINGLNKIYPDRLVSVYFSLIGKEGMANTSRPSKDDVFLTMGEAIRMQQEGNDV